MRKALSVWAVAMLCFTAVASAQNAKSQGTEEIKILKGTVVQLDADQKSFVLRDDSSATTTIFWDSGTSLAGGEPREGQQLELSTVDRDGKVIATSIRVVEPNKPL